MRVASPAWPSEPSELCGVVEPAQRPEVVPVGVHRMREVALVADRFRQDPIARALLPRELGRQAPRAQHFQVVDCSRDRGPELHGQRAVAAEAVYSAAV